GASPSGPPEHSGPSLFRRQDGRTFPVDVVLTHLPPEHGSLLYCSARDKTYEQVLVGDFRRPADPDTPPDNLEQPLDRLDRRQANQDSPVSQEFLESLPSPIAVLHNRTIIQSNMFLASMLGFGNTKSLVGKTLPDLCAEDREKNRISALDFRLEEAGLIRIPSLRLRKRDGETFPCDLSLTLLPGREGITATATFTDATDIARLRNDLEHSLDYQRTLFEKNGAGLLILDGHRTVVDVNPALCQMTGYEREEIVGHREWLLSVNQESFRNFNQGFQETLEGRIFHTESRFRCKNGSTGWAEITESEIPLPNGRRGVFLTLTDATALHNARKAIIHQVIHDPLTGIPNRIALEQALSGAIARARRNGTVFAVGMFDLDDFKPVNDKFGHEVGNRLLKEFSQRLRSQLRESDFLARIAGDEFVVVIEDLDAGRSTYQLTQVMERLHQAVEIPFKLVADSEAQVGMSMGLALFPSDGEDGDTLLRKAGAAMYQSKIDKGGRTEWWCLGPFPTNSPTQEGPFDAYSLDTNDLLSRHRPHIDSVILQFAETFFVQISDDPGLRDILSTMDEREIQTIAAFQSKHLSFLLAPSSTKEMILKQARQVGKVHALAGINGALLTQSMGLYRRLLSEHLNQTFLTARDRYRILLANEVRLQDDLQGELRSGIDTTGEYFTLLSGILPRQGALWTDVRTSEIDALGKLPGIQCVFLMRLDSNGTFVVEESSGPSGQEGAAIMRDPAFEAVIDPDTPRGQGLIAHAWRSLQIQRTPSYLKDARLPHWREKVIPLGIRSAVSIPVKNLEGKAVAVVSLYGAYPNQFESPWMQQFAMGLGQRWEKIWELCRTPSAVLREDQAMDYRKELFSGGAIHVYATRCRPLDRETRQG
ncbi:MAG: diguanylate cyclase, partial [Nitrospirota bacterium]|nr:diguanylate cyclase [Nitrospirota bacterium]